MIELTTLFQGYEEAFSRFQAARDLARKDKDFIKMYIPLFEVLNWTVVIDDRLRKELGEEWYTGPAKNQREGLIIPGFRFARNCVHHEWASAVRLDNLPEFLQDWCWRTSDELTQKPKKQENQRKAYEEALSSRALRHTFRDLHRLFRDAKHRLPSTDSKRRTNET